MAPLLQTDVSLKPFNTFGVDARARLFARVHRAEELSRVLEDPRARDLPRIVLGGGSNLLFTGDVDALVLKIDIGGREELPPTESHWRLRVGAGENWHETVEALVDANRPGLENLALIPGSAGAAPIQNIGAYGLELAERFDSLTAWDLARGSTVTMSLADCAFGYRDSVFKNGLAGQRIVLDVTFALPRQWQPVTGYADVANELAARGIASAGPRDVFDAVVAIRRRKLPDPAQIGNAGSFFKNPIVGRDKRAELIARFPSLVSYPLAGGRFKLAAGWLIDAAGLKGATRGRAGVYEKQALVLVNRGGATGREILALAREVQDKVEEKFGVRLEPEPVIL
jgi:UDP-N-acetylmuramate dehydrogenase